MQFYYTKSTIFIR